MSNTVRRGERKRGEGGEEKEKQKGERKQTEIDEVGEKGSGRQKKMLCKLRPIQQLQ